MVATVGQQWLTSQRYNVLQTSIATGNANLKRPRRAYSSVFAAVADPAQAQQMAMAQIRKC